MSKRILFVVLLPVLVFALAGVSYSWQGRMGGMGDPFGLVADESDYLIHPAKIAKGEGIRFYGDYRFTYTGVTKWDDRFPGLVDVSGQELRHNVLRGWGSSSPMMGCGVTTTGRRGRVLDYHWRMTWITLPGGSCTGCQ